jgi:hypothetical protein
MPNSIESVSCVAAGTEFTVDVYASHRDIERLNSSAGRTVICSFIKAFDVTGPLYVVNGDDFQATGQTPAAAGEVAVGTRAQADALGKALDLPVSTINCD